MLGKLTQADTNQEAKEHTGFTEIVDILAKNHRILTGLLLNRMLLLFCNSFNSRLLRETKKWQILQREDDLCIC